MGCDDKRTIFGLLLVMALQACAHGAAGQDLPRLTFRATAPEFEEATQEYRAIWEEDGARIVAVLRDRSGMRFPVDAVDVRVMESSTSIGCSSCFSTTPGSTCGDAASLTAR